VNTKTRDVIIVGGGVIGLMTARALAKRGLTVTIVERSELGREASYAAGGILAPQAEADCADDFFKLACASRDLYPALADSLLEETGIDIELDQTGTLYLAFKDADEDELDKRFEWQAKAGLPLERLTRTQARELEPSINHEVRAALHFPRDIQVDNRRLLSALIASSKGEQVEVLTGLDVQSLQIQDGRVTGVATSTGLLISNRVIIAAGAWSSLLLNSKSSPSFTITPIRGQIVCLQCEPERVRHVLYSPRGYIVPRLDGRMLAGSTSESEGFNKQVTVGGVASILEHALEIAPDFVSLPIVDTWAGLRPQAQDHYPVLGPSEIEGLFFATGHFRNGILLAPITAELLADMVASNVISPLLNRFAPNRFDLVAAE